MKAVHFLVITLLFSGCTKNDQIGGEVKIKLLIMSGRNNHEWRQTTPLLVSLYEKSGKFEVAVTERPDTLTGVHFSDYNAVVSNWAAWPEHDHRWPENTEKGLVDFIERGGGFVLFHAASATFYDWTQYQQLIGTTWGDSTRHGKVAEHKVMIKDKDHPITKNMTDFWITDELWVNAGVNRALNVLAESYSEPENNGSGKMEPVVHWKNVGKGRVFHNILGHNARALRNTGWTTLMLRGTEWAATGAVSIPVPPCLSKEEPNQSVGFTWSETDTTLTLLSDGEIVWQYNFNTRDGKPFFHPVNIDRSTITWSNPEDHPWHLGIWHSWKYINKVNYWEYDRSENVAPFNFLGVTEVRDITVEKNADFSCDIHLHIFYHEKAGPDLLEEHRTVHISKPDGNGLFYIDYTFKLKALAEQVTLDRTPLPHQKNGVDWGGYAGLSVRFSQDCYDPAFINSDGSTEKKHGEPMEWRYYGLKNIKGNDVGIAVFTDPGNLNSPEPWFMTDSEDHPFYYFSPAPIFNQPHVMNSGDELTLQYRLQFYQGNTRKADLDKHYSKYLEMY